MFSKSFADVISKTGMVPLKDIRSLLLNKNPSVVSELELLKLDFFDDVKFAKQIAAGYDLIYINLINAKVNDRTLNLIKKKDIVKYRCLPIQKNAKAVSVAIFDPTIVNKQSELQSLFQHPVEFILTNLASWAKIFSLVSESIKEVAETVREAKESLTSDDADVKEEDIGADVIDFVNNIMAEAYIKKASDIHIEPYEHAFRVRIRVDGSLQEISRPPKSMMLPLISRIKILAQMDISEKRKPQDGRIKLIIAGKPIDYRVSTLPTLFGEKACLRLLDQSNLQLDMTKLGFEKKQLSLFKEGIHKPYGMCLVTGPTGSGKTVTLYSALSDLNKIGTNISTAEDPCEFNLEGINQVNVRKEVGLTFASALKAFLRQDPDVIMVGEIRDFETGEIAVEAALTGHLVLSTLHTNDAPSTVARLLNMGIEPFLVTGALNVVVAQRLGKRICDQCKTLDTDVTPEELVACGLAPASAKKIKVFKGGGCQFCNGTGLKGRTAFFEVMGMTPGLREVILRNGTGDDIKRQAVKDGMSTLRMSTLRQVAQGITTLREAISVTASDKS